MSARDASAAHTDAAPPTVEDIANALASAWGGPRPIPPADLTYRLNVRRGRGHDDGTSGGQLDRLARHIHAELYGLEATTADPTACRLRALTSVSVAARDLDPAGRGDVAPDGGGGFPVYLYCAERYRALAENGVVAWRDALQADVDQALAAEGDPERLRTELLRIAGLAVAWAEAIDRRDEQP